MNSIDFCFWLQGAFELSADDSLTDEQVKIIKKHLNLVFIHEIDPLRESETTATVEELNNAHNGIPSKIFPNATSVPSEVFPFKHNGGNNNDTLCRC